MSFDREVAVDLADEATVRVLHVDDDPEFVELAATFLQREGDRFETATATSAAEALEVLDEADTDCIVSDYQMPETDGLALLRAVRGRHPDLPFVLFTGKGSEEIASQAISAGVTDYLQKGAGVDQYALLANRIDNAVAQYRAERELERTNRRYQQLIGESSDAIVVVDREGTFEYVSPAADRVFGYRPSDLVGENGFEFVHPEDRAMVERRFQAFVEDERGEAPLVFRFERPDGSWIWLEVRTRNLFDDPLIGGVVVYARDVTDYYERFARFEALVEHASDILTVLGDDGTILYENPAIERVLGYDPESLVGQNAFDLMHPDDRAQAAETMASTIAADDGSPGSATYRIRDEEGSWVWLESTGYADDIDYLDGYVVSSRDITERKRQEERLESVIERVTDAIIEVDADWRFTLVNRQAQSLIDVPEDSLLGRDFWEVFDDAVGTRFEEEYRRVMAEREPTSFVEYYAGLDGWFDVTAYPKDVGGVAFYFTDVTEHREHQQALERQLDRFRAVFEKAFDAMVLANDDGEYTDVNTAACKLFGLDEGELIGRRITDFAPEDFDFDAAWAEFQASEREQGTFPLVRPDGTRRTVEYAASVDIVPGEHLSVLRDVTERVRREREIDRQRTLLKAQQESVLDGILVVDESREILSYNEQFIELWDVPEAIVEAGDDDEVIEYVLDKVDQPTRFLETIEYLYDHPDETARDEIMMKDGRVFDRYSAPLVGDDGAYYGRIWTFRDITERIEHEQALERQNERLEEFAGIVSHDLRNPLTVVSGSIDLAEETGDSDHFERARRATDRMERLIEDLLTLAREGETVADLEPVRLGAFVEEAWQGLDTAEAVLDVDVDRVIQADRSRLQQVVENLIRNAVQHAGEDATVTVGSLDGGFYVEDDGPGIPPDQRDEVFEAGVSSASSGTGFGLRIVKQIADAHGWTVRVTDGSDGGARFEFTGVTCSPEADAADSATGAPVQQ